MGDCLDSQNTAFFYAGGVIRQKLHMDSKENSLIGQAVFFAVKRPRQENYKHGRSANTVGAYYNQRRNYFCEYHKA